MGGTQRVKRQARDSQSCWMLRRRAFRLECASGRSGDKQDRNHNGDPGSSQGTKTGG